jgi:hypothetical protein
MPHVRVVAVCCLAESSDVVNRKGEPCEQCGLEPPAGRHSGVDRASESVGTPAGRRLESRGDRISEGREGLESPAHHLHLHHAALQPCKRHLHEAPSQLHGSNVTDVQRLEMWQPFSATAGTYDLGANEFTIRPMVAKNPGFMDPGSFTTFELTTAGTDIWIRATKADTGSISPANANRVRLVRLE